MTVLSKPNDIARETLRLLVTRKEAPTPENYGRLYCEIAGGDDVGLAAGGIDRMLQRLTAELPRSTPELARLGNSLAAAAASRNWDDGHRALIDFAKQQCEHASAAEWAALLRELARLLRDHLPGSPYSERQTALERALAAGGTTQMLYGRLLNLTHAWAKSPTLVTPAAHAHADAACGGCAGGGAGALELRELLAYTLEIAVGARLIDAPLPTAQANALARQLRAPEAIDLAALRAELKKLFLNVELHGNARDGVQNGLLQLLRLLAENVGELVADDQWLRGQIAVVLQVISGPLNLDAIEEAQRNLKNAIHHQGVLKQSLNETKSMLKEMVASFIDELGTLSTATGDYHDSIESLAQRIRQTEDVGQLNVLLEEVLRETRTVQASALNSRREVLRAREQVSVAENRIRDLESELEQVSDKVLRDHLTGTLNRRGLNEAFDREIAFADRKQEALSIALLDIDNFKDLNDTLGHQVGDDALVHIAGVIKDTMRPSDSVARFGGEEFLILLPGSDAEQSAAAVTRLQREMTKRFFLHDNRKLLITFSAGIATYQQGDTQSAVIARADRALYQAKRAGKNRVVAA
ncbi:MAG: diguanylate cyclase [Betaproteobacteria bacterium]|nr:diguanylate cyclase [Betaproteobacteria bacterium]